MEFEVTRISRQALVVWSVIALGALSWNTPVLHAEGNELSRSPEQPASPDQWWLRSLKDGSDVSFSTFKGKVVFVNFWATWCGPCLQEMPTLERMYQKLKGKNIEMVVVANQNPRDLQGYLSQNKFSFPMYTCGMPPQLFMWNSLPTTFVVAPDGKVVQKFLDPYPFDSDDFIRSLEKAGETPIGSLPDRIRAWVLEHSK